MMKAGSRTLAAYALALVLPLVLFAALQGAFALRTARSQIETDALSRMREINAEVDGQLLADQSALQVLATSQSIAAHDWRRAAARIAALQRARPGWLSVDLTDVRAGREIWETRDPKPSSRALRPWIADYLKTPSGRPFSGIVNGGAGCPCVAIHAAVFEAGQIRYLLTVERAPQTFQDVLVRRAPTGSTAAIVDGRGLFIARTVDYPAKLGTPATRYVRAAIANGVSGLYPGVTYEGFRNYTAFTTSALTGWSAHVAVSADVLTGARRNAAILTAVAALVALILALAIAAFAYRQSRIRRLEDARSAQSQKLAAVGQLASGIAHDFNNLLMVITNSLAKIADSTDDPGLRRPLENAMIASERGVQLIRQLMAFTRAQPLEIGSVDLKALVDNLRGLLAQSLGRGVAIVADIADDTRWVSSNASQLEMALVNLAMNARDAMPDGGAFTLRARPTKGRPESIDLDVIDTGEGMPKEVIDRAMEPFFTTKPLGKGTGLGLAQVFGVVSQSQGSVDIRSKPGAGTTIALRLPRAEPPAGG